ncbi:MAG TPA: glycoside hydrolase family 15 protein [Usitatibacter sp.]|nr:glycoside hydrolase family 15 protein [Usitatibacter sp.]
MDAPGDFPDVGDYALIGNCRTAALVSNRGSVEWMCVPTFSDASIFGAILDRGAGHFSVAPVADAEVSRAYIAGTNVLQTTFKTPHGVLRLTDCLVLSDPRTRELYPQHELLRRVECASGEVEVEVSFAPRYDYGRGRPRFAKRGRLGWQCLDCSFGALLAGDLDLAEDKERARLAGKVRLAAGEARWLSFAYDESEVSIVPPLGPAAGERLEATIAWWKGWCGQCRYDGPYRDEVLRSALVLKLLNSATSGAVLAAPTTSLPEVAGGPRNWDYRYCWIRDSALVLHAFLHLNYLEEAEGFLEWLLHATRLTWQRFQVMYDLYGEVKLDEKELAHLSGYRGAKPVRIGNAAHDQLQLDIYGELMATVTRYVEAGGTLDAVECAMLAGVGKHVMRLWRLPDQGIWETRRPPRMHTFSKAMCWVALDRLGRLADRFAMPIDRKALERECDAIRAEIEEQGYDEEIGSYVAYYGGKETDAALLLLARYGYREPGHPRMEGTYRYIVKVLCDNGLIHRYRDDTGFDGFAAPENAFAPCNFWAVEYLANAGHYDEARKLFERLCRFANDVGLFAEEIGTRSGKPVGNFPQAFTHVSLISAASALFQRKTA